MVKYPIKTAENGRKKCYYCGSILKKGSNYIEIGVSAWNNQLSRRGVCRECVKNMLDQMTGLKEVIDDCIDDGGK